MAASAIRSQNSMACVRNRKFRTRAVSTTTTTTVQILGGIFLLCLKKGNAIFWEGYTEDLKNLLVYKNATCPFPHPLDIHNERSLILYYIELKKAVLLLLLSFKKISASIEEVCACYNHTLMTQYELSRVVEFNKK